MARRKNGAVGLGLLLLVNGCLFGCGGSSSSNPAPTVTASATAAPTASGAPSSTATPVPPTPIPTPTATPTLAPTPISPLTWNLYNNFSGYYIIPYASPTPSFGSQMAGASLEVTVQVCDSQQHCTKAEGIPLDTGSRGLWIAAQDLPTTIPSSLASPGYIFYNSSGRQIRGNWVNLSVSLPDATPVGGVPTQAAATVPVLLANQDCLLPGSWPEGTPRPSPASCSTPSAGSAQMGIGFDRTGYGTCPEGIPTAAPDQQNPNVPTCPNTTAAANQNYNPFLNITGMQTGMGQIMNSGFILTQSGVILGLTASNTAPVPIPGYGIASYAFEKLLPTGLSQVPNSPPDWLPATGSIAIDNVSNTSGQAVIDIGINDMLVGPATPVAATTPVPAGYNASVALLGLPPGTVGYSFVVGDTSNPLAPMPTSRATTGANYSPYQQIAYPGNQTGFAFLNTGIDPLNAFNYLYDGQNGYIGLQINTAGTQAFHTPMIGAGGTMSFPDGFVTNLPINLLGNTTIATMGTITLNGPIGGTGSLTIAGGTVNINCPSAIGQGTVVTQGTLVIGSQMTPPPSMQGSATVQTSLNNKCGGLTP